MMRNLLFSLFLGFSLILVGSVYAQDPGTVTPPESPTLSLDVVSATEINLTWEDNSDNETGFTVLRSLASDFSRDSVVTALPANTTAFNDTELSGNETYYYQVIAVNTEFAVASNAVSNVACAPDLKFDTSNGSPVWIPYYTVNIGEEMELQGRIINKANCTPNYAAQPTYKVFLSEDNVLDADDINLSEVSFGDLKEGEGADLQSVTIPNDVTLVGARFLIIQIDPAKLVYERDELNNTYSLPITISNEIDIKILNFSVNGVTDNKLDVTYDVANLSNGPVGGFEVSFSSTDNFIGTMHVDGIPVEDTVTVNGSIFIPCDGGGAEVIANLNTGSFVEPNTENNSDTIDFVYAYDPSLSNDLSVRDLVIDKSTINVGESFTINSSARGDINGNNNITYFLSSDANLDGSDLQLGTSGVAPAVVCGNSDEDISQSLTIPVDAALGDYYVLAVIDYADDVNEEFENNNIAYASLVVTDDPDLVVSNVVVTNTPENMGTISVTFDITNQGLGPVGASTIGAYLSDDNSFTNAVAIITDNVISIPAIASGATYSGSATFAITSCDAVGEQFLFIKADKNNLITESIEENNTNVNGVAVSIANVPDLEITHLAAPAATSGNSIIANITISNNAGTAQASTLRFYLSNNVNIGSSDIEIKSVAIDALDCSGTAAIEEELLLPEDLADGKYVMIAVIDAEDAVAEMDENNNIGFFVFNKGVSPLDPPVCEIPTGLMVSNVTETSATLSWDAVPGVSEYLVRVNSEYVSTSTNTYSATGLPPGASISWKVKASCEWSEYGPKINTTGDPCIPTGLTVSNVTDNSAVLNWDAIPGATEYLVRVNSEYVTTSTNTYLATGLPPGTTVSWKVKASCEWSEYGPKINTTGDSCIPSGLAVSSITNNSAVLNWDAIPGATEYLVRVNSEYVTTSTNTYSATGLPPGASINWKVKAGCEWSAYGPKINTTGDPCIPTGLMVSNVTNNSAVLNWDAIPGATEYLVRVNSEYVTTSTNTYSATGLPPGASINWKVKAGCEWSAYGPKINTTGDPCIPTGLTVSNVTDNSAVLNWDAIPGATEYLVRVNSEYVTTSTNTYSATGLPPGATITWKVKTDCEWSEYGPKINTTGDPCIPTGLTVSDVTDNSAVLNWDAIPGATEYLIRVNREYVTTSTNTYLATGLPAGASIIWKVKAGCEWSEYGPKINTTGGQLATVNSRLIVEERLIDKADGDILLNNPISENLELILYPNPSIDEVEVTIMGDEMISAIIAMDMQGVEVKRIEGISLRSKTISLSEYGVGIYVIKVVTNNNRYIIKKMIIK